MALHLPQIQLLGISAVHGNASLYNTVRELDASLLCRPIERNRLCSPALTYNSHTEMFCRKCRQVSARVRIKGAD